MRPAFGCGLRRYLMEPNTIATRALIRTTSSSRSRSWEPRIQLRPRRRRPRATTRRWSGSASPTCTPARQAARQPRLPVLPGVAPCRCLARSSTTARTSSCATSWSGASRSTRPSGPTTTRATPGITLLELFAFLGENLLYRFNQIPDATELAFLRLLDVPLRPPTPAARPGRAHAPTARVPACSCRQAADRRRGRAPDARPRSPRAAAARPLPAERIRRRRRRSRRAGVRRRAIAARGGTRRGRAGRASTCTSCSRRPTRRAPGAAAAAGRAQAVDGTLWIALLRPTSTDPRRAAARCSTSASRPTCRRSTSSRRAPAPAPARPAPAVVWQAVDGPPSTRHGDPQYVAVTRSRRHHARPDHAGRRAAPAAAAIPATRRLRARRPRPGGHGRLPAGARGRRSCGRALLFWLRAFRPDGGRSPTRAVASGVNAAEVEQARTRAPESPRHAAPARPARSARSCTTPVLAGSAGASRSRSRAAGPPGTRSTASRPAARAIATTCSTPRPATVRFGDGVRGRAPQIGERIRARELPLRRRRGGQRRGRRDHQALDGVDGSRSPTRCRPRGGADGETIADALERVPGELRRRDRAVTRGDFQELALATPGEVVARRVPAAVPPAGADDDAAGVVSVVVWPREDRRHPDAPVPDRALLRAVCAWLDARRLVTTELYVIPPTYRQVAVAVGVAREARLRRRGRAPLGRARAAPVPRAAAAVRPRRRRLAARPARPRPRARGGRAAGRGRRVPRGPRRRRAPRRRRLGAGHGDPRALRGAGARRDHGRRRSAAGAGRRPRTGSRRPAPVPVPVIPQVC